MVIVIHKFFVMNLDIGLGITLYDDGLIEINDILLNSFVQAMMNFTKEFGDPKGALREAEIGKYQLSILERDELVYVVIQDTYDNEPFTKKVLEKVLKKYHQFLRSIDFSSPPLEMPKDIPELLQTMEFPREKMDVVNVSVNEFLTRSDGMIDTFFLADYDGGIIKIWKQPEKSTIITTMMELLSEIPFERYWIGETKLKKARDRPYWEGIHEGWFIWRIGLTDFCMLIRAFYTQKDKEKLVRDIEILEEQLNSIVSTM